MVRWERFQQHPERVWVNWNPDDWPVSPVVVMLVALFLIGAVFPGLASILTQGNGVRSGERTYQAVVALGLLGATLVGVFHWWRRSKQRETLALHMHPNDWVCAKCLHVECELPA